MLEQPIKPGVKPLDIDQAALPPAVEEPAKHTLRDLAAELVYFTPALLLTHTRFPFDPVAQFVSQNPEQPRPFAIDCQQPFFQSLPATMLGGHIVHWDHRLYAVPHAGWEACREHIARIAFSDRERQHYVQLEYHTLQIVDPTTMLQRPALTDLPTIEVTVFDVTSNRYFVYIDAALDPPRTQPFVVVQKPKAAMLTLAAAVLGPPPDPAAALSTK